jgi:hypothetical protein
VREKNNESMEDSWGGFDIHWELESLGGDGPRLTLWHNIDRRFISWGAPQVGTSASTSLSGS